MTKILKKAIISILFLSLAFNILYITPVRAYSEEPNITGRWFLIKNAFSGQYLTVENSPIGNGTRVEQQPFQGEGKDSQIWYAHYIGNGDYLFATPLGSTTSGGTLYLNYALNINGAINNNGARVQIWGVDGSDPAQRFALSKTLNSTYVLRSYCSNYSKAVAVENASVGWWANIIQWQYNSSNNDEWILEPVHRNNTLGVNYAIANFDKFVAAYPNLNVWHIPPDPATTADCANFVSQCLLASGLHERDNWYVYKYTKSYPAPTNPTQLDNSWILASPSPWISANQFKNYWTGRANNYETLSSSYIRSNPSIVFNKDYYIGDVISIADKKGIGGLVGITTASHTMYITDYQVYDGKWNFALTYHSIPKKNRNLLEICELYPDSYFVFYHI